LFIPKTNARSAIRPDWLGAGLMAAWLVAVLVAISQGEVWGWGAARQLTVFGLGIVLLVIWLQVERQSSHPMIDTTLMSRRPVWTANAAGLLYGYCLFTSIVLVPQFVETPSDVGYGFGASVTAAGLYLLPSTATMVLMGPVTGWISTRFGPRVALILGTLASALAFLGLALAHDESWHLYLTSALLGAGNGLCYGALPNIIVNAVPPARTGTATGINVVFRNIGGALGSQVAASIVAASVIGDGDPTERAFTVAFLLGAAAPLIALLLTVLMPKDRIAMDLHPLPETAVKL
jgi:MFS family permease